MGPQCLQQPELTGGAVGRAMMIVAVAVGNGLTVVTIGAGVKVATRVGIGVGLAVRVGVIVAVGMIVGAMWMKGVPDGSRVGVEVNVDDGITMSIIGSVGIGLGVAVL